MEEDLGLVGNQYQIGVSVLFITYCLFEAPSNMILKQLRPKTVSFLNEVYVMAACQFCSNTTLYAFSVFLPTIIRQTGDYSIAEVQCLTIPIYILGAVLYISSSFWSDKIQVRGPFIIFFNLGVILGYVPLQQVKELGDKNPGYFFTA